MDYENNPKEFLKEVCKKPFRSNGKIFCAFSLDEPLSECPFLHRGRGELYLVNGTPRTLYRCYDARIQGERDDDYNSAEIVLFFESRG